MSKAQAGRVDSDYAGRPTREEIAAAATSSRVPASYVGCDLPDGRHALTGPGGKLYHEHFVDGRQVWDQPVNIDDYRTEATS